jgi:hypothetical protein
LLIHTNNALTFVVYGFLHGWFTVCHYGRGAS